MARPTVHVRRIPVAATDPGSVGHDYADAFEIEVDEPEHRTAEELARAALEAVSPLVRRVIHVAHRHALGFDLAAAGSPGHIAGWAVAESSPAHVRMEATSRLLHAVVRAEKVTDRRLVVTTSLWFRQLPAAARAWAVIGPVHRAITPVLLRRAAVPRA